MIILGIDPAIRCSGYSIVDFQTIDKFDVIDCGIIRNPPKAPHSECLRRIAGGIRELIKQFKPEAAAIEAVFYGKNIKTSMILSMARGTIITVLAEHDVPVYSYSPRTAKRAVAGNGAASKEQLANLIASTARLCIENIPLDATDAIALALCHANIAMRPDMKLLIPDPL
ncbi:MAG: crossover junction endodeoxyribonuclease RuvC [Victivallaceae bacterium]|nr:crossover junction endodeoxyribonuclease RuvC [Victivallaceae bacterium]